MQRPGLQPGQGLEWGCCPGVPAPPNSPVLGVSPSAGTENTPLGAGPVGPEARVTGGDCGEGTGWGLGKGGWASHLAQMRPSGRKMRPSDEALGLPWEAPRRLNHLVGDNHPLPTCGHHERLDPHFLHTLSRRGLAL